MGLDIAVLVLVLIAFFNGYKKGLIFMALFFVGITIGLLAALKLSGVTATYLEQWFSINGAWLPILSLVITFLLAFLIIRFIAGSLEKFLKLIQLNILNRIAGAGIGTLIAIAFCSILIWYIHDLNFLGPNIETRSVTYNYLRSLGPEIIAAYEKFLPFMKGLYEELSTILQEFALESKTAQ